jgi:hypothetical protein
MTATQPHPVGFWAGDPVEIVLFAVGIVFTFTLLGVFLFVLTRKEEHEQE